MENVKITLGTDTIKLIELNNPDLSEVEIRRLQRQEINSKVLESWKNHAETLSEERRNTILLLISKGKALSILQQSVGSLVKYPFVPKAKHQIAVWNGNPYACGIKELYELYDEINK